MDRPVEILLVEDNPADAELTLRALKTHNLANNVLHARDGAEALEFLFPSGRQEANVPPRLIILDLKLPKVSGLEILQQLKANPATKTIPVVVMTSSQEERDLVESYELGTNSYIVKPVAFDEFVRVVSDVGLYWLLLNKTPS